MKSTNKNNKEKLSPRVIVKLVVLITLLSLIVLIPIIYSGVTYIKAWNKNAVPFEPTVEESDSTTSTTESTTEEKKTTPKISGVDLTDVERMNNEDFNLFDVTFVATSYNDRENESTHSVTFSITIKKNDNTPSTLTTVESSSSYMMKTGVCLQANWIGFESYQSSLTSWTDSYLENGTSKTASVSCNTQFPAKAETWPIKVTVDSPTAYLYILFRTQENGKYVIHPYILKYLSTVIVLLKKLVTD